MKRFAASIEYFGTNYNGWQKQSQTTETIQEKVENAFSSIANEEINIICSGRTDAGVHALGQVAHVDFDTNLDIQVFKIVRVTFFKRFHFKN